MNKGFTLIELIVVIAISASLLIIVIANFGFIRFHFALTRAAEKFAQDARRAQSMATVAEPSQLSWPPLAGGYGVYLDIAKSLGNKKYIIYADTNNDQQYFEGKDTIIETIDISKEEPGVFIKQISDNPNNTNDSINTDAKSLDTNITVLNDKFADRVDIIFALESDPTQTKTVTINTGGLIEVK